MKTLRRDQLSILGAVVALAVVIALAGWRTAADAADWEAQRAGPAPQAPLPETGQMRRRRGLQ
ncbi:MAG: hypothetical protein P8R54_29315 [Myxococcota bacterium]|jgi:hypothetical protein|nr:hypothetical protein [Myxococcota bacterium]